MKLILILVKVSITSCNLINGKVPRTTLETIVGHLINLLNLNQLIYFCKRKMEC